MLLQMRESVSVLELIPSLTSSGPAIAITMIHDRAGLGDPWHKWPASDRTKGIEILDLDGPKRTKAQAPWDRRGFRSVIANKKFEYWKLITIWGLCRRGKPISTYEECFSGLEPRQLNEIASISIIFSLPCYCDIDIGGASSVSINDDRHEPARAFHRPIPVRSGLGWHDDTTTPSLAPAGIQTRRRRLCVPPLHRAIHKGRRELYPPRNMGYSHPRRKRLERKLSHRLLREFDG